MIRNTLWSRLMIVVIVPAVLVTANTTHAEPASPPGAYVVVLGIAQDGGVPQAGSKNHPGWEDESRRHRVACLAVVDPESGKRWMIDCTPDFKEQLHLLDDMAPREGRPGLDGIFLTHAHMGHYTGLAHLGKEVMGASEVPVYAMSRLATYLETNGPWDQLVRYRNIRIQTMSHGMPVRLTSSLTIEPFLVPHRQEYSEVVGFRIVGPRRAVLFIPDIDSWEEWDMLGTRIESEIARVDVAYLDGTFYANGEIPGRDMSRFPHPFVVHSMERFAALPASERNKVRFIHLNHTNAALIAGSTSRKTIEKNGFAVAVELERVDL